MIKQTKYILKNFENIKKIKDQIEKCQGGIC
jgi:hypothetical protein